MKRIAPLLAALVLLLSACGQAEIPAEGLERFQIAAADCALELDTEEPDFLEALSGILSGAQPAKVQAEAEENRTTFWVTAGDAVNSYAIFTQGDAYYLEDEKGQAFSFDASAFFDLLPEDAYGSHFLPRATLEGQELATSGSGRYRRLEGWREQEALSALNTPFWDWQSTRPLPLPEISPESYRGATLTVTAEGETLFSGDPEEAVHLALEPDTQYVVVYTVQYEEENFQGSFAWNYGLTTEAAPPPMTFSMEAMARDATDLGEVVVLRVENLPQGERPGVDSGLSFSPSFFDDGKGGKIALLPVSYYLDTGTRNIRLFAAGESREFALTLRETEFDVQHLTVDASTTAATIGSQAAVQEFNQTANRIFPVADEEKHWQGRFVLPCDEAPVTTTFGTIRYTNGSTNASRHEAIDYDLPEGARVGASGAGRVLYAGYLQLTGNTVVIEHGWGLKTWYYHMSALNVETDDMVAQDEKIGEVGTTGFSTGSHLHFGMSVNNVYINPLTAIQTDLLAW